MSDAMTKRDFTVLTENAKNRIIERLVTKYDVQAATDSARDRILSAIQTLHTENQATIRQANAQRDQLWRRISALENQTASLQADIRNLTQTIERDEEHVLERESF